MPDSTDTSRNGTQGSVASRQILVGQKVITLSLSGGGAGRVFRLNKGRVVIGGAISADVRLSGAGIAPIHAVIELVEGGGRPNSSAGEAMIYDLASATGVLVNGRKIITSPLRRGDRITLAGQELVLGVDELANLIPSERTRESEGQRLFLDSSEDLAPLLLEEGRQIHEIFEFAPTTTRALEVVMAWNDTVLAVEHFVSEREVTIGTTRNCVFGIPPLLTRSPHALVTRGSAGQYSLVLDPKMKGVMQRNGALQTLEEIRSAGDGAQQGAGGYQPIPLLPTDFTKVSVGDIDFYLSYTAAPPRLKLGRVFETDPVFHRIFGASMVLTLAVIVTLMTMPTPQNIEAEQLPERIATILYQPEKYPSIPPEVTPPQTAPKAAPAPKPVPVPKATMRLVIEPHPLKAKPVPKDMAHAPVVKKANPKAQATHAHHAGATEKHAQNEAKEGEGARAKGKEGTRGSKNASPGREHQDQANRPSPQGGPGRGAGDSQVKDEGNVDFLKASAGKIENILGNSAAHLGAGGERLKGFGGFTTQGNGGLALSGNGAGGGGDADSLGGLGKKGHGGGKVGTGLGASGSGSGIVGGMSRVSIRTGGPEEAVVMGSIDADAVEAALLAHKDEFRLCYEKEVNAENPNLAGRVGTTFVIGSTGRVNRAGIESTSLHNANTERCILSVIKRIDFPIPRGAGVVQVSYPFKFSPVGR